MKKHLQFISTVGWTREQWLAYRHAEGFGASDIGGIMTKNQYNSPFRTFLVKTGQWDMNTDDNIAMYMGRRLEDLIAEEWKYYTTHPESILANRENPNYKPYKCRKVNGFLRNPKYPHLYVSLDRLIPKGHVSKLTGEILTTECPLELKTISKYSAEKWISNIPESYLYQIQAQIAVTEAQYGEIAILKDGREMDVFAFERSELIIAAIMEKTSKLWNDILVARKLIAQREQAIYKGDQSLIDDLTAQIQQLEPEPNGTDGDSELLKERYRAENQQPDMQGSPDHVRAAAERERLKYEIELLTEKMKKEENFLKNEMKDSEVLNLGIHGRVTYRKTEKGHRMFKINLAQ